MDNIDDIIKNEKSLMKADGALPADDVVERDVAMPSDASEIVADELIKARHEVASNDEFKGASLEVAARGMHASLTSEALAVLSEEQKNAYKEYVLQQEKKKLDYKIKYEKKLVREEVKAEVYKRKVDTTIAMYGQYYKRERYKDIDENGNEVELTRYKNFTTSKFVNKLKVFSAWYRSLEENVRKIIATTLRIVIIGGFLVAVGYGLYGAFKWLANSGILANLTQPAVADKIASIISH